MDRSYYQIGRNGPHPSHMASTCRIQKSARDAIRERPLAGVKDNAIRQRKIRTKRWTSLELRSRQKEPRHFGASM
jgi:hypothetical protein